MFDNIDHVMDIMTPVGYFIDRRVATVIFSCTPTKPVLVEGPAGSARLNWPMLLLRVGDGFDPAAVL